MQRGHRAATALDAARLLRRLTTLFGSQRNGTLDEVSTIYTGHSGMENFGYIDTLNGRKELPFWNKQPCNSITGSEGEC